MPTSAASDTAAQSAPSSTAREGAFPVVVRRRTPPVVNHRQRQRGTGDPAAENQQRQGRGADDGQGRGRSQDVAGGLAFSESAPKVAIKMLLAGYRSLPADRDRTSPHRGVWGVDGPNGTREASRRRRLYWGGAALFLLQLLPRSLPRTAPLSPT